MTICFTIRGNPVAKARARKGKRGFYTPSPTAEYEKRIQGETQVAMAGMEPLEGPLAVEIDAVFALPKSTPKKHRVMGFLQKKPDIDNIAKSILDGMQPNIMADDKQVVLLSIAKFQMPVDEGWAVVRVREAEL